MKKILAFLCVLCFSFSLVGCGNTPKENAFRLVEKKYDSILEACIAEDVEALLSMKGISKVNVVDGYIIVFCKGEGISVSSQDYGFYYSAENHPITVDCNQNIVCGIEELTPKGNGFECVVSGNTFYTEPIKGNIYFYSNAY